MKRKLSHRSRYRPSQSGMTLIETVIALAMLFIVAVGIMAVAVVGTTTTENQGHLAARAAEYAQDKMEQLISLSFCDLSTDTTQFPACDPSSGCNNGTGLAVGGSTSTTAPVTGYVDYLDLNGNPLALGAGGAAPANWYYVRAWQISTLGCTPPANYCSPPPNPTWPVPGSFCTMKQIAVSAKVRYNVGTSGSGALASGKVISQKTWPF